MKFTKRAFKPGDVLYETDTGDFSLVVGAHGTEVWVLNPSSNKFLTIRCSCKDCRTLHKNVVWID